ncbi:hypothetical protein [Kribbella sp. DT2]
MLGRVTRGWAGLRRVMPGRAVQGSTVLGRVVQGWAVHDPAAPYWAAAA